MKSLRKKILVTGGAGFIGSHLADRLIQEGHKVVVVDNLSSGKKENLNPQAKFYRKDIRDSGIADIFKKERPEIVFHYAAQINLRKSIENPVEDAKTNILGSINILENCRKYGIKKVIFASTGGAMYSDAKIIPTPESRSELPDSPYGIAKLTVERYLDYYFRAFGLPYISLRLANVYGPRQNSEGEAGVIAIFCQKMLSGGQPIINGDGKQTRDFIFVEDVVEANILAMENDKQQTTNNKRQSGIFNIGTAKETSINSIFRKLKRITKSTCGEKHGHPKMGEQRRSCLDSAGAKKELGWEPRYPLDKGLKATIEWFKKYGKI